MPLTSDAFTLHDNTNTNPSAPTDLIPVRPRRSTRASSNTKLAPTDANGMADGRDSLTARKSNTTRRKNTSNIDSDADDVVSPAIQQTRTQNGRSYTSAPPTRSRHKKAHSQSKSKDLAVNIAAADRTALKQSKGTALSNGSGFGAIKELVIDWEIPRKVLHSSIGKPSFS